MIKSFGKQTVYVRWLVSYFIIILVFFVLSVINNTISHNVLNKKIEENSRITVNTVKTSLDSMLSDTATLANNLSMPNADMTKLCKRPTISASEHHWRLYELRSKITNICSSYTGSVDNVAVYLKDSHTLVSQGLTTVLTGDNDEDFFNLSQYYTQDMPNFQSMLINCSSQNIYINNLGNIIIMQPIPFDTNASAVATLMLVLPSSRLKNIINHPETSKISDFFIVDGSREITFSLQDSTPSGALSENILSLQDGSSKIKADGNTYITYAMPSSYGNFRYVYTIDEKEYFSDLNRMSSLSVIMILLTLGIGIFLSFDFTKRNYAPIHSILEQIKKSDIKSEAEDKNEMHHIENAFSQIMKNLNASDVTITQMRHLNFATSLRWALSNPKNTKSIRSIFDRTNRDFNYPYYSAALISINEITNFCNSDDMENEKEIALAQYAVQNIFEEYLSENFGVITIKLDDSRLLCMIGSEKLPSEKIKDTIKNAFIKSTDFASQSLGIYYSVSVGDLIDDIEALPKVYEHILNMGHQVSDTPETVVFYEPPKTSETVLTKERQAKLVNMIRSGNADASKEEFNKILSGGNAYSGYFIRDFKYFIMNIIASFQDDNITSYSEFYKKALDILDQCSTISDLKKKIPKLLEKLCSFYSSDTDDSLGKKIMDYINQNYSDPNLNVNMLGEHFHLTPNYLSKIFKSQTGEFLRDYILYVRIEQSKKLLASNLKVYDVALQCGFSDSGAYIRVFKKYQGITPKKYRDSL